MEKVIVKSEDGIRIYVSGDPVDTCGPEPVIKTLAEWAEVNYNMTLENFHKNIPDVIINCVRAFDGRFFEPTPKGGANIFRSTNKNDIQYGRWVFDFRNYSSFQPIVFPYSNQVYSSGQKYPVKVCLDLVAPYLDYLFSFNS